MCALFKQNNGTVCMAADLKCGRPHLPEVAGGGVGGGCLLAWDMCWKALIWHNELPVSCYIELTLGDWNDWNMWKDFALHSWQVLLELRSTSYIMGQCKTSAKPPHICQLAVQNQRFKAIVVLRYCNRCSITMEPSTGLYEYFSAPITNSITEICINVDSWLKTWSTSMAILPPLQWVS